VEGAQVLCKLEAATGKFKSKIEISQRLKGIKLIGDHLVAWQDDTSADGPGVLYFAPDKDVVPVISKSLVHQMVASPSNVVYFTCHGENGKYNLQAIDLENRRNLVIDSKAAGAVATNNELLFYAIQQNDVFLIRAIALEDMSVVWETVLPELPKLTNLYATENLLLVHHLTGRVLLKARSGEELGTTHGYYFGPPIEYDERVYLLGKRIFLEMHLPN